MDNNETFGGLVPNSLAKKNKNAAPNLLPFDYLKSAAETLKCMAHPHRLRIIEILLEGEYTVDAIAQICSLSQPATSGHLRLMESKGLLISERRGRTVFYSVNDDQLVGILDCIRNRYQSY